MVLYPQLVITYLIKRITKATQFLVIPAINSISNYIILKEDSIQSLHLKKTTDKKYLNLKQFLSSRKVYKVDSTLQ